MGKYEENDEILCALGPRKKERANWEANNENAKWMCCFRKGILCCLKAWIEGFFKPIFGWSPLMLVIFYLVLLLCPFIAFILAKSQ